MHDNDPPPSSPVPLAPFFRDEGADILIVARTDARAALGLEEALERCREFRRIGADITFLDAPESVDDMQRYCKEVDGPKLAIMIEVMDDLVEAKKKWGPSDGTRIILSCGPCW